MFAEKSNHFLLILLIGFFILVLLLLKGFMAPIILGMILATFTYRFYHFLEVKLRGQKNLAALVALLVIIILVILPFLSLFTLLGTEAFNYFTQARDKLVLNEQLSHAIQTFSDRFNLDLDVQTVLQEQVAPMLKNVGLYIYEQIGAVLSSVLRLFIDFFIMLLTIFYLLRDGESLAKFLLDLKLFKNSEGLHLFQVFRGTAKGILFGSLFAAFAQGALGGLGFFIFGLPAPVFWGAIMAFLALIPVLGPFVIFLPASIYVFITASTAKTILFLLFNLLLFSTIDNLIKPKIIGNAINIHPFFIFLTIFGAINMFGLMGVVYGPLIAAMFLVLIEMYQEHHTHHEVQ